MKKEKRYEVKSSAFFKWAIGIIVSTAILLIFYVIASEYKWLYVLQNNVTAECNKAVQPYHDMLFVFIFIIAICYVTFSLLIAVRSTYIDEDPRLHLLSVLVTPVFLILENAALHIMHVGDLKTTAVSIDEYYSITMSVFCAIAVAITTFSSLKFSFDLSSRRKRFNETANVKPDIIRAGIDNDSISVTVSRNSCYINGIFVGDIKRFKYIDSKRPGTSFLMEKLYFTNSKYYLSTSKNDTKNDVAEYIVKISELLPEYNVNSLEDLLNGAKQKNLYVIIRDTQNYYYFVQASVNNKKRFAVGVSENTMSHLVNKNNSVLSQVERDKHHNKKRKAYKYEVVDRFVIPFNFYPDIA